VVKRSLVGVVFLVILVGLILPFAFSGVGLFDLSNYSIESIPKPPKLPSLTEAKHKIAALNLLAAINFTTDKKISDPEAWVVQLAKKIDAKTAAVYVKKLQDQGIAAYSQNNSLFAGPVTKEKEAQHLLMKAQAVVPLKGVIVKYQPLNN
jgi:cell division septation protein DedD